MDLQVGKHKFGYLREHDPKYVVPGTMTARKAVEKPTPPKVHVVGKGETLGKIAKANNMTLDDILKKNPQIKNPDKIGVGQKINV